MKQKSVHRVRYCLAGLMAVAVAFVSSVATAKSDDLTKLAESPQDYLGRQVEVTGHCVKGGVKGDVLGYECTTEGDVYIETGDIEPATAKEKVDESCKGEQQDAGCRATIRLVPHSFTTSNVLVPNKTIIILNTEKAELSF